jgi:hypothetical protein
MCTRFVVAVAVVGCATGAVAAVQSPEGAAHADVVQAFELSVVDYVALRNAAVAALPPLESSNDAGRIQRLVQLHHAAIATARRDATQGDLFFHDVATLFRHRVRSALAERELDEIRALASIDDEVWEAPPLVVVNGWFPWHYGSGTPACVIQVLPPLPHGLEYRFVHTSLLLVDTAADLIVDILPDVLRTGVYAWRRDDPAAVPAAF